MGGTYEGIVEEPVEVTLEYEFRISVNALEYLQLSCVAVSPDCFLAYIKPGNDVGEKYYRFSTIVKLRTVSRLKFAGASCPFLYQRELREDCRLKVSLCC